MNERIKELAQQAGYTPLPGFDFANSLEEVFIQKFAELIVKECAMHLHRRGVEGFGILEERNLKEHFGVES